MAVLAKSELLEIYTDEFYRLTNEEENHFGMQYKTGINTDILPFSPTGESSPGGMYFVHISKLHMYPSHCVFVPAYVRKVSFTENSIIYVERDKFKTNEFVLGEREKFSIETLSCLENKVISEPEDINKDAETCRFHIMRNGINIKYVNNEFLTSELCELAVKQNPEALKYISEENQSFQMCKMVIERNKHLFCYVKNQTEELSKIIVKIDGNFLKYVKIQTPDVCNIAVEQNGRAILFVDKEFLSCELWKLALSQNIFLAGHINKEFIHI